MKIQNYFSDLDKNYLNSILDKINFVDLNNKSIFITGGTGFLGSWIVKLLYYLTCFHNYNIELFVLTRDIRKAKASLSEFRLQNINFIESNIIGNYQIPQIDYVIHAANDTTPEFVSKFKEVTEVITLGTLNLLEKINNTNKLVYLSSGAVYGTSKPMKNGYKETQQISFDQYSSVTNYGLNKLMAEKIIMESGMDYSIFRCFAFFGRGIHLNGHFAASEVLSCLINRENIHMKSPCNSIRNYMYPLDLAIIVLRALVDKRSYLVNIGAENISIKDLIEKVCNLTNIDATFGNEEETLRKVYVPNLEFFRELSLHEPLNIEKTIEHTVKSLM